jgi:6-phosphofructokinase
MAKYIGVLTSGGDCPGLNSAIRGVGKAARDVYGMEVIGFRDGFRGLMQDRFIRLDDAALSGILTLGGTILGTSRDKPHRMLVGGEYRDMTDVIVDTYKRHQLDALVCLGGGGTQKNALRLHERGLNVITLPKTIDNDVAHTDVTFGFDTALEVATEAIDRLHSTATSHHRIIVVEIMGHNAGWLALGAGIAAGADVILIPEIAYDVKKVAEEIRSRTRAGKRFSIVAVSEGAMSIEEAALHAAAQKKADKTKGKKTKKQKGKKKDADAERDDLMNGHSRTMKLTRKLEELTGTESRLSILGHLQRGGTPSAADRVLATCLGAAAAALLQKRHYGVMVAARGASTTPVPLEKVAGQRKTVPLDHPWITTARMTGVSLGD